MRKCRKCICRSCLSTCGCRTCQETDGAVSFCDKYNQYEQLSFIDPLPKPVRQKLPRFITWNDYGITRKRYKELRSVCNKKEYANLMYAQGLGRIPCGRTDFYGYRRLFYNILDKKIGGLNNENYIAGRND